MNREDVVKAADIIKKYCVACLGKECDCPLLNDEDNCIVALEFPAYWHLEEGDKE